MICCCACALFCARSPLLREVSANRVSLSLHFTMACRCLNGASLSSLIPLTPKFLTSFQALSETTEDNEALVSSSSSPWPGTVIGPVLSANLHDSALSLGASWGITTNVCVYHHGLRNTAVLLSACWVKSRKLIYDLYMPYKRH